MMSIRRVCEWWEVVHEGKLAERGSMPFDGGVN